MRNHLIGKILETHITDKSINQNKEFWQMNKKETNPMKKWMRNLDLLHKRANPIGQ